MKLQHIAEAAIEFYGTPNLLVRQPPEDRQTTAARHVCQWIACEALTPRYKQSAVARFWDIDGSSVHYGRKMVKNKIEAYKQEKEQLKEFLEYLKGYHKAK
jgi:hypothetical protein